MHETLEENVSWLDSMLLWPDGWNGYDALAPTRDNIERAKLWLTELHEAVGAAWFPPTFVTGTGRGGVCIEWICDDRKVTVDIEGDDFDCLRVWGKPPDVGMMEADSELPVFLETWHWLQETNAWTSTPPA